MWKDYIQKTRHKPVSAYLIQTVELSPNRGVALDLGSGSGMATRYLVDQGFTVQAVDAEPFAAECIKDVLDTRQATFTCADFSQITFNTYNLINASYSLPFIASTQFNKVWHNIQASLTKDGLFVGEFFGPEDSWNTGTPAMTFHSRRDLEYLFKNWQVITLHEENKQGTTASGSTKRWHVFHVIAQKPAN